MSFFMTTTIRNQYRFTLPVPVREALDLTLDTKITFYHDEFTGEIFLCIQGNDQILEGRELPYYHSNVQGAYTVKLPTAIWSKADCEINGDIYLEVSKEKKGVIITQKMHFLLDCIVQLQLVGNRFYLDDYFCERCGIHPGSWVMTSLVPDKMMADSKIIIYQCNILQDIRKINGAYLSGIRQPVGDDYSIQIPDDFLELIGHEESNLTFQGISNKYQVITLHQTRVKSSRRKSI